MPARLWMPRVVPCLRSDYDTALPPSGRVFPAAVISEEGVADGFPFGKIEKSETGC